MTAPKQLFLGLTLALAGGCNQPDVTLGGETSESGDGALETGAETGGEDDPLAPPERSGSRLRARYLVPKGSTDAPAQVGHRIGWHDSELGIDCSFVEDVDGVYRCLPTLDGGLHVYSTATCEPGTDVMAISTVGSSDGADDCDDGYVRGLYDSQFCNEATAGEVLRLVGPATATTASHPFVMTYFGDCNPWSGMGSWKFCAVEPVSPAVFVAAEDSLVEVGGVRQRLLLGADGSIDAYELLHPTLDAGLYRDYWTGAELIPVLLNLAGESACVDKALCDIETPPECAAAVSWQEGCGANTYPVAGPSDTCDGCTALGPALAKLPYTEVGIGSQRLHPLWITADDRPVADADGYFFDDELGMTCWPQGQPDGRRLCVPDNRSSGEWIPVFSDEACQTLLGEGYVSSVDPSCPISPPTYRWITSEARLTAIEPIGAPLAGPLWTGYIVPDFGVVECQPLAAAPTTLYQQTPADPSLLVELEEVVE